MDKQNPQAGPLCRREPTREQRFQGGGVEKTQQSLVKCGMPASPVTSLNSSIHRTRPSLPLSVSHEPAGLYLPRIYPSPLFLCLPPWAVTCLQPPASPSPDYCPELHCHQALTPRCLPTFCPTFSLHKQADLSPTATMYPPAVPLWQAFPSHSHLQRVLILGAPAAFQLISLTPLLICDLALLLRLMCMSLPSPARLYMPPKREDRLPLYPHWVVKSRNSRDKVS